MITVISERGIEYLNNPDYFWNGLTIIVYILILIFTLSHNRKMLLHEKRLSSRVILDYEEIYGCGLRLERYNTDMRARILESDNFLKIKSHYTNLFDTAQNCFELNKYKEEYINNCNYIRVTNPLNIPVYDCVIQIEIIVNDEINTIKNYVPMIGSNENVFILYSILPDMKLKSRNWSNGSMNLVFSIPFTAQIVKKMTIEYKTVSNEIIQISNTYGENATYSVNIMKKRGSNKIKETIMINERVDGPSSWIYPKMKISISDAIKSIRM